MINSPEHSDPPQAPPRADMDNTPAAWRGTPRRVDLHCHSKASNKTGEAALNAIGCPESYSPPADVYEQARRRGMDFVTITDHDNINGVTEIAQLPDVLIGEELTCWFPEDHCKMHVLVYGLTPQLHEQLQSLAKNIYDVAEFIEKNRLAHSVAHPIYRQNDRLERWHLERLILIFKGFECLNGAHSGLHREAFEPVLDHLTRQEIGRLSATHDILPRWPSPWIKARTAGSDDHGLLNIGRTWTEFPPDTRSVEELLEYLRVGNCRPGGEPGSVPKLAHTFYGVGVRYYTNKLLTGKAGNLATALLQTMVGEKPAPTKMQLARYVFKSKAKKLGRRLASPFRKTPDPVAGTAVLKKLFLDSAKAHFGEHPALRDILAKGLPPLGEHSEMFEFVSEINRDVTAGVAEAIQRSIKDASFTGLFDSIGAAIAHQFVLMPYYFACFHQNKERHLLREITRQHKLKDASTLRVGLFTDTLDEINGVARFIRDMGEQARKQNRHFIVHTCTKNPTIDSSGFERKNFLPQLSMPLPYYADLTLNLPPLLEIMEWADRQQFDAIHVSTPGPMGLCGWVVSKMLRVPLLGTYHTDFPAYVDNLARDHRVTNGTVKYMKWFYGQMATVFSRSNDYLFKLHDLGMPDEKLRTIQPGVNTDKFSPLHAGNGSGEPWNTIGVQHAKKLLYAGRVSVEKNLPLLADAFRQLCGIRNDVALIIAGDGPYLAEMRKMLVDLPVHFLGAQNDIQLARLYASSDLFVFPSRTDTLGQVVMEAQASGLPVLVSTEGGPKEMMGEGVTGHAIPATDASVWCHAIDGLLTDDVHRQRLARSAPQRMARHSLARTFESFWDEHVLAVEPPTPDVSRLPMTPDAPVSF